MTEMDRRFRSLGSVVIKLTSRCNIRCAYCYEDIRSKGADMSSETFQNITKTLLSSSEEEIVQFILHGGEPTVLSDEWFAENLEYAYNVAAAHGKELRVCIQTNLIKISQAKLELFKKYRVGVGGSIDSPDLLAPALRPLATNAIQTFLQARQAGIYVGVLTTINSSNAANMRRFCGWLLDEMDVHDFKANVAYPVGAGLNLQVPRADAIFQAQQDIIEFMIEGEGALLEDNLSEEIIRFCENLEGGLPRTSTLCDDQRCGAGTKVVGVSAEGQIFPCGRFAWSEQPRTLGDMAQAGDEAVDAFFEKVEAFHSLNPENWAHCNECDAKPMCGFGCQAFIVRSKAKKNIECEPTKLRLKYYRENRDAIQRLYEIICERRGTKPLSRFEQKLSRLRTLVPLASLPAVHEDLQKTLASALQVQ